MQFAQFTRSSILYLCLKYFWKKVSQKGGLTMLKNHLKAQKTFNGLNNILRL